MAANAIVLGGGAGATPSALGSLGTTATVLHGNAAGAPTFGAVSLTADVTGTLPLANGGIGATAWANIALTWTSYSPTYSSSGGTGSFTTVTTNSCKYLQLGKLLFFQFDFTITTLGGAAGYAQISLPVACTNTLACTAYDANTGNTQSDLSPMASSTLLTLQTYNHGATALASSRFIGGATLQVT